MTLKFTAPLQINGDWTPAVYKGTSYYSDIGGLGLPSVMRNIGGKVLAVWNNTSPDAYAKYGEAPCTIAKFISLSGSTVTMSDPCVVYDFRNRPLPVYGSHENFINLVPMLNGQVCAVIQWGQFRAPDGGTTNQFADTDVKVDFLDLRGSVPVQFYEYSFISGGQPPPTASTPAVGRPWEDTIVLGMDTGTGSDTITWYPLQLVPSGNSWVPALGNPLVTNYVRWTSAASFGNSGKCVFTMDVTSQVYDYYVVTHDHATNTVVSAVYTGLPNNAYKGIANSAPYTYLVNINSAVSGMPGLDDVLITASPAWYIDVAMLTFNGTTAVPTFYQNVGDPFIAQFPHLSDHYRYDFGSSRGIAVNSKGVIWQVFTVRDSTLGNNNSLMFWDSSTNGFQQVAIPDITNGEFLDGSTAWGLDLSLAFDAQDNLFVMMADASEQQPWGKYFVVAIQGSTPPLRFRQRDDGLGRDTGNAHINTIGLTKNANSGQANTPRIGSNGLAQGGQLYF